MGETNFQPAEIVAALERHGVRYVVIGGLAATLHGSSVMTTDANICPARERDDLERLARALVEVRATFLARIDVALNLTTKFGDLDLSFIPSGTGGFPDLDQHAVPMSLMGRPVAVASLADVIRSKEAANRPKDQIALPALRLLLERMKARGND